MSMAADRNKPPVSPPRGKTRGRRNEPDDAPLDSVPVYPASVPQAGAHGSSPVSDADLSALGGQDEADAARSDAGGASEDVQWAVGRIEDPELPASPPRPSLVRAAAAREAELALLAQPVSQLSPYAIGAGGGVAAAGLAGGGGGGGAVAATVAAVTPPGVGVIPGLGPVIRSDNLAFRVYALQTTASGTRLTELPDVGVSWNANGTVLLNLNGYRGMVMVSLYSKQTITQVDTQFLGDYRDEATAQGALLGTTVLRGIGLSDNASTLTVHVTPLTEVLVRQLGFASAEQQGPDALSSSKIIDASPGGDLRMTAARLAALVNALMGVADSDVKALTVESLLGFDASLSFVINSDGFLQPRSDLHGKVLALISHFQNSQSLTTSAVIERLAAQWLDPVAAQQSETFLAFQPLTLVSGAGTLVLNPSFDTGYGSATAPATDNGTLSDNITSYRQPRFDISGLDPARLRVNDVIQVIDTSAGDQVVASYKILPNDEVLTTGSKSGIQATVALSPGAHNLKSQVLSFTGQVSTASTALSITVETNVPDVSNLRLTLSSGSDSSNASLADGSTSTTSDNITNVRTPTLLLTGLSGKALNPKDRIDLLTQRGSTVLGSYVVNAADLNSQGYWTGSNSLDIAVTSPLPDVSDSQTNGIHDMVVRITGRSGTFSSVSTSPLRLTIDATAPTPTLRVPAINKAGATQDRLLSANDTVDLELTYNDMRAGDVVRFYVNGQLFLVNNSERYKHTMSSGDVNNGNTYTFTLKGFDLATMSPANGELRFSAIVTDIAGNANRAVEQVLWWGPPTLTLPAGQSDKLGQSASSITLNLTQFALDSNDQVVLSDGQGRSSSPYTITTRDLVAGSSFVPITLNRSLLGAGADGTYAVSATVLRNGEALYTTGSLNLTVDTVAPTVDLNGALAGTSLTNTLSAAQVASYASSPFLFANVAPPADQDIAAIRLRINNPTGPLKPGDRMQLGGRDIDLNQITGLTATLATVGDVSGVDFLYQGANKSLTLSLNSGAAFSPQQVQKVLGGMEWMNSGSQGSVSGTREISVDYVDLAGNMSANPALFYLVI